MEWIEKNAIELYECSSGLSKAADQFGFGYPFLSYSDIFHNYYVPEKLLTLVNSTEKERKSCSVKKGDVFLTRTSETTDELGMSCVALQDYPNATFNGFAKRLRPITNEIVPEYASYFFRSSYFRAQCMSLASLITRASLNEGMIGRLKIRYPKSKDAQAKIGSILKNYDNLIENNNKRIKILEQMAENLYKEWFVRFRFPGHETTPFENGIPKDWMIKRVDELAKIKAGGDRPDICEDEITDNCKVPVYSNGIENEGLYGFTDVAEINKASVTISARGTIGYVCLRRIPFVPIVRLLSVTPNTSEISVYYLYYLLKNDAIIGNGTSQQQITVPMLGRKKILVPENSLVKSFTAKVESIWNEIDLLKNSTANLIKQRDLLLPRLMSGKLAV